MLINIVSSKVGGKEKSHIGGKRGSNQSGFVFNSVAFMRMMILKSIFYCWFVGVTEKYILSCGFFFSPKFSSSRFKTKLFINYWELFRNTYKSYGWD